MEPWINLNQLDADLSYETRVSFIAAANQKILDEIMSLNVGGVPSSTPAKALKLSI